MGRCPNCNAEIKVLLATATEIVDYYYDGKEYEQDDVLYTEDMVYRCPECHTELTRDEAEARAILGR
jgi:uncharacterized protein with PIN domain